MVTPMGLMADQAVLLHRRMLPHERPPFFGMAFETEVVDRVGLYHFIGAGPAGTAKTNYRLGAKTAHCIVTTGAFERLPTHKSLLQWMMRLFIYLSPDVLVTVEA
jgi:hypothetical protein